MTVRRVDDLVPVWFQLTAIEATYRDQRTKPRSGRTLREERYEKSATIRRVSRLARATDPPPTPRRGPPRVEAERRGGVGVAELGGDVSGRRVVGRVFRAIPQPARRASALSQAR